MGLRVFYVQLLLMILGAQSLAARASAGPVREGLRPNTPQVLPYRDPKP